MTLPEIQVAAWQRRLFAVLQEFFQRAYGCGINSVPNTGAFGDWIRANARRFAERAPAAYTWAYDQLTDLYEESRKAGVFGLGKKLGGVKLVLGGSSRFTQSHLAAVTKMVLYADTVLIPDPILPWIESPRTEERFRHVLMAENAFMLLHLKPLVDADLPYPPIVVFPSWEKTLEVQDAQTRESQQALLVGVLSDALGHSFDSLDAVEFFVRDRAGEFLGLVDERKLLIGPGGQPGDSLATSIRLYREEIQQWRSSDHQKRLAKLSDSAFVFNGLCERIGPMYHLFENAEELIANPLMPLAVHWYYYRLCSRFFEHRLQKLALLDPRVMAEMQALENTNLEWLGTIPIDALLNSGSEVRTISSAPGCATTPRVYRKHRSTI